MSEHDTTPLVVYRTTVPSDWIDYNGHMNDACYAVAFSRGCDEFMVHIGMDAAFRERTGHTIYTVETHICYLDEAKQGEAVHVALRLAGHDGKRARLFMALYRDADGALLATQDGMYLNVDGNGPTVTRFHDDVAARLQVVWNDQKHLPVPSRLGRAIKTLANDITASGITAST